MSSLLASFPPLPAAQSDVGAAARFPNPFGAALGARHVFCSGLGEGHRDFLAFPRGLYLAYSRFRPATDSLARCEGRNLFKMHFSLAGRNSIRYDGQSERMARVPSVSMSVHPAGLGKADFHPGGVWEHSLTLACPATFLAETLRLEPEGIPTPLLRFATGLEPQLFFAAQPLPGRARRLIEELLSPPCENRVAHLHAEARALDLLCLGLDLLIAEPGKRTGLVLSLRDVRALQALRERIAVDFLAPRSIDWLARCAGMNRTKLTRGFRDLFGETVGDYVARLRMQHASHMLEAGFSAAAVAAELGYRHQSSFATAFRAHLGKSPSTVRRRSAAAAPREMLTDSKQRKPIS